MLNAVICSYPLPSKSHSRIDRQSATTPAPFSGQTRWPRREWLSANVLRKATWSLSFFLALCSLFLPPPRPSQRKTRDLPTRRSPTASAAQRQRSEPNARANGSPTTCRFRNVIVVSVILPVWLLAVVEKPTSSACGGPLGMAGLLDGELGLGSNPETPWLSFSSCAADCRYPAGGAPAQRLSVCLRKLHRRGGPKTTPWRRIAWCPPQSTSHRYARPAAIDTLMVQQRTAAPGCACITNPPSRPLSLSTST